MNKILCLLMLAAAPVMAQAPALNIPALDVAISKDITGVYGYFFNDNNQRVHQFDAVRWSGSDSVHSLGVWLYSSDPTAIVLVEPGVYFVSYVITAKSWDSDGYRFGLFLNDNVEAIRGSIYATPVGEDTWFKNQLEGQVVFRVSDSNSYLYLVNLSEDEDQDVHLVSQLDADESSSSSETEWFNVGASIFIQKVSDLY